MHYQSTPTDSPDAFLTEAITQLTDMIQYAIETTNACRLGLSGGSTPGPVYEAVGGNKEIDWSKVHLFLVDDRYVPADHDDSNQKLVRETLLKGADIPEEQIYFPDTSLEMDDCIKTYTASLMTMFQESPPDVLTLGLGPDGHIASLFPPVAEAAFGEILALHTTTDEFAVHDRISISPLVIMATQAHLLLLKGEEKIAVFEECAEAEMDPSRWPLHVALATERVHVVMG